MEGSKSRSNPRGSFHRSVGSVLTPFLTLLLLKSTQLPAQNIPALKDVFKDAFKVGTALSERQFNGDDKIGIQLIERHFNTISPENVLKWERVHPRPGVYEFGPSDRFVEFGEKRGMFIVGHTLAWHSQVPRWVFQDSAGNPLSKDSLLARLHEHISTVVGRYKGRIQGWDVVNEALNEDGTLRNSPWLRIAGPEFIEKAFIWAHEADPNAELYYNDYSMENAQKRAGGVRLIKSLLDKGIKVTAVGMQDHLKMGWPSVAEEDSTIKAFVDLGVKVNITELDVDVLPPATRNTGADVSMRAGPSPALNPYVDSLPAAKQEELAKRYAEIFQVFMKYRDQIDRITFWGVADSDSWLNGWPIPGRTAYPLLFDRARQPKPAFNSVVLTAGNGSAAPNKIVPQTIEGMKVVEEKSEPRRVGGRNLLTQEELLAKDFQNVYDALEALRPFWLRARGPNRLDPNASPTVKVYLDNVKLGAVSELKMQSIRNLRRVYFLTGPEAQARYGVEHENGAVVIETLGDQKAP
jgi:endo-1,4-beta-xylanase